MNEAQLQTVISDIVRRVLNEGAGGIGPAGAGVGAPLAAPSTAGRVLVGICCDGCLSDTARAAVDGLGGAGYAVSRPAEEEFKKRAWRDAQVAAHDVILLPAVCYDLAAKMAMGIFDEPVALLAMSALAQGKPVIATVNTHYDDGLKAHSPVLRRLFEGHRRQLGSYGIEVVPAEDMLAAVQGHCGGAIAKANPVAKSGGGKRRLVTAEDIEGAHRNGKKLSFPAGSLVTPLARDRAKELGLEIEHGNV